MHYPNSWKEDRRSRRGAGSRAREPYKRGTFGAGGARPPPAPKIPSFGGAAGAARLGTRFLPVLGLGILGAELGWYWYQSQFGEGAHGWQGPSGWDYGGPCAGFANPTFAQASFLGIEHCFGGSTGGVALGTPIPDHHTSFHLGYQFGSKIKDREWWRRNVGDFPGSVPHPPGEQTPIAPSPIRPGQPVDPMDVPLEPSPQVAPDPLPISPHRPPAPRNWRSPTEGRQVGPAPAVRERPEERLKPSDRPATEIELLPRPGPAVSAPGSHSQKPPKGRGNKERKMKTKSAQAFNMVRRLFESAFEGVDILEAIFLALPKHIRDRYPGWRRDPRIMIAAIHRHAQTVDMQEMLENLIWNEVEDFLYGGLGRVSQTAAQRLHLSTGPQFGSGARRAEVEAWRRRQARDDIQFLADETLTFK